MDKVKLTRHFMFAYDSLELADLKAEFEHSPSVIRYIPGSGYTKIKPQLKFYYGYCGIQIVTLRGVVNPTLMTSAYKLIFSTLAPWGDKHTRRDLANPKAKIGVSAVTGEGAKATFGIPALASVVLIDNNLYKRMTLRDIGRRGSCGLRRSDKKRLVWFLRPIGVPTQEVVDALLEKVI